MVLKKFYDKFCSDLFTFLSFSLSYLFFLKVHLLFTTTIPTVLTYVLDLRHFKNLEIPSWIDHNAFNMASLLLKRSIEIKHATATGLIEVLYFVFVIGWML